MSSSARLDSEHEVLPALRRLLPDAAVAGGSFAHWLPDPRSLPSSERRGAFSAAKAAATEECISHLLNGAGLPPVSVVRQDDGQRRWPFGFVGSLSHEGTTVVGALASVS